MSASENTFAFPTFTAGPMTDYLGMDGVQECQICQDEIYRQVGATLRASFAQLDADAMLGFQFQEYGSVAPVQAGTPLPELLAFGTVLGFGSDYISDEYPEGLALSDDEVEDIPSELAENMAMVLTDQWENGLPSEFDQDEPSMSPALVRQDQWLLEVLNEAMSSENLCQDLLHYQWVPEASPEFPVDRIHYLLQQYGCAHRFLIVSNRWSHMKTADWLKEMTLIVEASDEVDNKMTLWPQIDAIFTMFVDETRIFTCQIGGHRGKYQLQTRRALVHDMRAVGKGLVKGIEQELKGLLPKDIPVLSIRKNVMQVVAEDCEKLGSLRLGRVLGFTESTKHEMTEPWSWTD